MLQQALDFMTDSNLIHDLLRDRPEAALETETQFKGWTINDILAHLHHFNELAVMTLQDEARFQAEFAALAQAWAMGATMREATDAALGDLRGRALLDTWYQGCQATTQAYQSADPKHRVKWAGPDMSVLSSITARLMETWAHGQAIFDIFGADRADGDRIRNVALLGVNTFGWTYKVRKWPVPAEMPHVELSAPSGELWVLNAADNGNVVRGRAVEFAQVVAQTRNIADTGLHVAGDVAQQWMQNAQCFAGPAHPPPAPGSRFKVQTTPAQ